MTISVIVFLVIQSTYTRQYLEGRKVNYPQTETPLDTVRVIEAVFVFPAWCCFVISRCDRNVPLLPPVNMLLIQNSLVPQLCLYFHSGSFNPRLPLAAWKLQYVVFWLGQPWSNNQLYLQPSPMWLSGNWCPTESVGLRGGKLFALWSEWT